ncbi:MAG: hypothetical protein AB1650_04680 [Candidatus Omnitrophota bacterium]
MNEFSYKIESLKEFPEETKLSENMGSLRKIMTLMSYFYTIGAKERMASLHDRISAHWKIPLKVFVWLIINKVNTQNEKALENFITAFVDFYRDYPNAGERVSYYLSPFLEDDNEKMRLFAQHLTNMSERFPLEFLENIMMYQSPISGSDYYVFIRFGSVESTHGIYLAIRKGENGENGFEYELKNQLFRVGVDTQGNDLRIVMMQGILNETEDQRQRYRKDMEEFKEQVGIHPVKALMYFVLELAEKGYIGRQIQVKGAEQKSFRRILGIRPEYLPCLTWDFSTTKQVPPAINYIANYKSLGLRKKSDYTYWETVERLVSLRSSRLNSELTSASQRSPNQRLPEAIKKIQQAFAQLVPADIKQQG